MNEKPTANQLLSTSIRLAAVPTAVPCSRMFVRTALERWKLTDTIDTASLVMSELVTNAITAAGITDPEPKTWQVEAHHVIGVQLRVYGSSLFTEVWDGSPMLPVSKNPGADTDAEGGRGLVLIGELAKRWDVYRPAVGGKVVWAQLELGGPAEPPPLHGAPLEVRVPGSTYPPPGRIEETAHLALIERMLDGTRPGDGSGED